MVLCGGGVVGFALGLFLASVVSGAVPGAGLFHVAIGRPFAVFVI